jgi:hypothetical protein
MEPNLAQLSEAVAQFEERPRSGAALSGEGRSAPPLANDDSRR